MSDINNILNAPQKRSLSKPFETIADAIVFTNNESKEEIETSYPKNSAEHYFAAYTTINKKTLDLLHPEFKMRMDGEDLYFDLSKTLGRRILNEGITHDQVDTISFLDFLLPSDQPSTFDWISERARAFRIELFEEGNEEHQFNLMAYYAIACFVAKYNNIKTVKDIDRPIPCQVFVNILNKEIGKELAFKDNDGLIYAGGLNRIFISKNMFTTNIFVELNVITASYENQGRGLYTINLPIVRSAKTIEDIGLITMTDELKAELTERGKKYIEYTSNPVYKHYTGFAHKPGPFGSSTRTHIDGRVMIDLIAMRTLCPKVNDYWYKGNPFGCNSTSNIEEENLWACLPVVYGFSFYSKEWVGMNINNFSEIKFSDNAFDNLIIPQEYKDIFIASLTHDMPSLDKISGKGAGKIFLLCGLPGIGKTMTAESVAEFLHKPLYYVTVGELGTNPNQLEENLNKIMEIATNWDAIVLLDEVDVFAQNRNHSDIVRTAMTAILLRLLERYSGIMFMTTNLLTNIDPAFLSRATATIEYNSLSVENKHSIWKDLLQNVASLGIAIDENLISNLKTLSEYDFNGREIKNIIRLSYSLAKSKGDLLTYEIIQSVVKLRTHHQI